MPIGIDFAGIAAKFRAAIEVQNKSINNAFESLGKWLSKRVHQVDDMERATSAFPVVRFHADAITMWITSAQHGILGTAEPPGTLGGTFRAAGGAFVQGVSRIGQAVKEDLLLPQFFRTVAVALETVLASIERFAKPSPGLFDTSTQRRASDLFGEIGLLIRASTKSLGQISGLGEDIPLAKLVISIALDSKENTAEKETSFPELLDNVVQYLVGAMLLLPLIPELWDAIVRSASLDLKIGLLATLQEYEQQIVSLRWDMLDYFFVTLFEDMQSALGYSIVIELITHLYLDFYSSFIGMYTVQLLSNIRRVLQKLSDYLKPIIKWTERIRDLLDGYLLPIILALISPEISIALSLETLLLPELPPEARVPTLPRFPTTFLDTFLNTTQRKLDVALGGLRDKAQQRVSNLFEAGIAAISDVGQAAEKAAQRAARGESLTRFQGIIAQSDQLEEFVFEGQSGEERPGVLTPTAAVVARTLERFLAQGVFYIIGAAIPLYVAEMQRYWRAQKAHEDAAGEMLTSQHITARRQRLGLIRVPRVVIRIPERALDDALASEVATRLQEAIVGTYASGLSELAHMPNAPGRGTGSAVHHGGKG